MTSLYFSTIKACKQGAKLSQHTDEFLPAHHQGLSDLSASVFLHKSVDSMFMEYHCLLFYSRVYGFLNACLTGIRVHRTILGMNELNKEGAEEGLRFLFAALLRHFIVIP